MEGLTPRVTPLDDSSHARFQPSRKPAFVQDKFQSVMIDYRLELGIREYGYLLPFQEKHHTPEVIPEILFLR